MIEALIEGPFARITAGSDLRLLKLGSTFTVAVGTPSVKIHGATFTAVSRSGPEFPAEHDTRTRLIGCQPRVDASSRENVTADQKLLIVRLKLGETLVAIASGDVATPDRAESKERQRNDQRQVFRRHA